MTTTYYYAQTFAKDPVTDLPLATSLQNLFSDPNLTHLDSIVVYLSSLHIGTEPDTGKPYLHLNDVNVNMLDAFMQDVHHQCSLAVCHVEIRVMLGGAGGAYTALFYDYDKRYALLCNFLKEYPFVHGIDLDVEESLDDDARVALTKMQKLITQLHTDFVYTGATTPFSISMAPVAYSLTDNSVGMGGFSYKELLHSSQGSYISQWNVQAYGCYDAETFQAIVDNGFDTSRLVFGMLGDEYEEATDFTTVMTELETIATTYPTFRGAIIWEYGDTKIEGVVWGQAVRRAICAGKQRHAMKNQGDYSCVVM